jgi:hypothetical protein
MPQQHRRRHVGARAPSAAPCRPRKRTPRQSFTVGRVLDATQRKARLRAQQNTLAADTADRCSWWASCLSPRALGNRADAPDASPPALQVCRSWGQGLVFTLFTQPKKSLFCFWRQSVPRPFPFPSLTPRARSPHRPPAVRPGIHLSNLYSRDGVPGACTPPGAPRGGRRARRKSSDCGAEHAPCREPR